MVHEKIIARARPFRAAQVGGTVNACTKGIWLWGKPLKLKDRDLTVVFLDTEGLGSTDRSQTDNTRIFALALLLASTFVYNSRGVIDGSSIEDLSLPVRTYMVALRQP